MAFVDVYKAGLSFFPSGSASVPVPVRDKLRQFVSITDRPSASQAVADAATIDSIYVPFGGSTVPISAAGKNILWQYPAGGDSRNVLMNDGTRGGYFSDYDCKANYAFIGQVRENQTAISGGGIRDGIFIDMLDSDTADYSAIGQKVTNGIRSFVQGVHNGSTYQAIYKDLVGGTFAALGNVQWAARGVSAINADAWQYGVGIASNEFSVNNPAAADGGISQSESMAAGQFIVRSRFGDEGASNRAWGIYIENHGKRITSGIAIASNTTAGQTSHYKAAIDMSTAVVSSYAILMPLSASGDNGTIIVYDSNDYTQYLRTANQYNTVIGGSIITSATPNGLSIGSATTTGTWLFIEPPSTTKSQLRLFQGTSHVTSPADGDIWRISTGVYMQEGATRVKFTTTPA